MHDLIRMHEIIRETAALGYRLFPVSPRTKRPLRKGWITAATSDPRELAAGWSAYPWAHAGLLTGAGVAVVDLDVKGGLDGPGEFSRFAAAHGGSWSPTVTTRSGGSHVYYRRTGDPVKTRAGVLPGVDVRGRGGYVVVYGVPPAPGDLDELPQAVVELVGVAGQYRAPVAPPAPLDTGECSRWGRVRLERNLEDLAAARGGCRNLTLNRAAYKIAQAVAAGHIPHGLAWAELARVAASIGLGPVEVERTLHSAFRAAQRDPRGPE